MKICLSMNDRVSANMSIVPFLLLLAFIRSIKSEPLEYESILQNQLIREKFKILQPESIFQEFFSTKENWKLNETCSRDLRRFEEDLKMRRPWALKMLDSSSTVSSGLLKGNFIDLGMFDECLEINEYEDNVINAGHCMYSIGMENLDTPIQPQMSICLPTSCNEDDLVVLVEKTIKSNERLSESVRVLWTSCSSNEPRPKSTGFWLSLIFFLVCIGFVVLCTICDLINRRTDVTEENASTLSKFSIIKATEKLLRINTREDEVRAVHGMRFLSTIWIVFFHECFLRLFTSNINAIDLTWWLNSWPSILPILGIFCVDTFFAMSGFLLSYNFFKKRQKGESFNLFHHYIHRYLRLSLPIVALIASSFILLAFPFSGALYEWLESIAFAGCRTKWWSIVTYTQNFVEPSNRCLQHLWYLTVDMQLYLISPLILYPLYKKPKIGRMIVLALIFASIASTASIVGLNKYSALYFSHDLNIQYSLNAFDDVYQMPYTRASPWLIGIALGYKITHGQEKPTKIGIFAGWLLAIFCFGFCVIGIISLAPLDQDYNITWEVTYASMSKPLWGIGICWLIYACYHGCAGHISTFLSWELFGPLSKLSYSIYLVHLLFPFLRISTTRTPLHVKAYVYIEEYICHLILSIILAFFLHIFFEAPMLVMDSLIYKKKR